MKTITQAQLAAIGDREHDEIEREAMRTALRNEATYLRFYATESGALSTMRAKNRAHARGDGAIYVVIDGPEDNWAVVDLKTAIEMDMPYRWEV